MTRSLRELEQVAVRTADGLWLWKVATSDVELGHNFPVVWVAWPDTLGESVPWPPEDVVLLEERPDAISHADYKASLEADPASNKEGEA